MIRTRFFSMGCLTLGLLTVLSAPAIAFTALIETWVSDAGETPIHDRANDA